jgi:hypothetical protein
MICGAVPVLRSTSSSASSSNVGSSLSEERYSAAMLAGAIRVNAAPQPSFDA